MVGISKERRAGEEVSVVTSFGRSDLSSAAVKAGSERREDGG